jgi:hypothetical protein
VGPHLELHPTPAIVEVSAKDAHVRRIGTDHLAHFEGICLRQPVQHRVGDQARESILLSPGSCTLRSTHAKRGAKSRSGPYRFILTKQRILGALIENIWLAELLVRYPNTNLELWIADRVGIWWQSMPARSVQTLIADIC